MINSERYSDALRRAGELISSMTREEKIAQLTQYNDCRNHEGEFAEIRGTEGKRYDGVGSYIGLHGEECIKEYQERVTEQSPCAIPLLIANDVIHGYKTTFPTPLAQSCTWEPSLAEKCCRIAGKEAYNGGTSWVLAPMIDIARDPRWGRIVEGYGEDVLLCSDFARASVEGFQGKNGEGLGKEGYVACCLKHFIAYGAGEGGRDYNTVEMTEQTLLDVYAAPFKAGIDAGAASVMAAYHEVNGVPCSASRNLLRKVLREELGFSGFVVSDCDSVPDLINHGYAADERDAVEKAFNSGVDVLMVGNHFNRHLPSLIDGGKVSEGRLDEALLPFLTCKILMNLRENAVHMEDESMYFSPEHRAVARECAKNAAVLLENNGILPLSAEKYKGKRILLCGPAMANSSEVLGPWSFLCDAGKTVTVESALREELGESAELIYNRGCSYFADESDDISGATEIARGCDLVILSLGDVAWATGEAASRSDLTPTGRQLELYRSLRETGVPIVVLLTFGRPMVITEFTDADALLWTGQLGTEHGHGISDVLMGHMNPCGHLTTSLPRHSGQLPIYYARTSTGRPYPGDGAFEVGYRDVPYTALYPFGYGKSYTEFEYSDLRLSSDKMGTDGEIEVTLCVKNTGEYGGHEVIQLYVRDLVASRVRPIRELKGYRRIFLSAGESADVTFTLPASALSFRNGDGVLETEPGEFRLWTAKNSADEGLSQTFFVE